MSKSIQRVLLFFVGLPLLLVIIIGIPHNNHLLWNLLVLLFTVLGTLEMTALLGVQSKKEKYFITVLTTLLPLIAYLEAITLIPPFAVHAVFFLFAAILLTKEIFISESKYIESIVQRVRTSIFILVYPGYFIMFIVRLSSFQEATYLILLLLLVIFANDTLAYLLGTLFGKRSRQIFTVSPNKSLTGFISGTLLGTGCGMAFAILVMPPPFSNNIGISLILCFLITITANIGDLIESAIKRSAQVKDSGTIIPGRGGVLDSIDSILFSAPFFYYGVKLILTYLLI